MVCKICRCGTDVGSDGRCRSCRIAKTATDMGTSYGKLEASIWLRFGNQVYATADNLATCPGCGKLFLPRTQNQIYCSNACAVKAAQKAYRKRRRTQASRAPVDKRKESPCSSSDASTAEASILKPSIPAEADTTATPSAKGKTG